MAAIPHTANDTSTPRFRYKVAGMDCASCAKTIEKGLEGLDGLDDVQVSFTTETIEGTGDVAPRVIRQRIEALGYRLVEERESAGRAVSEAEPKGLRGFMRHVWQQRSLRVALAFGVVAVLTAPLAFVEQPAAVTAVGLLHLLTIAVLGFPIARRGLTSLVLTRRITIDLLMTIAAIGAVAIGATGEAVTVVLLFTLGEALEGYSAARARASLGSLIALRPDEATVIRERDGHRHFDVSPVSALEPGDRVLVRPGERIPADGHIAVGASAIDQSAITGEAVPAAATAGDEVFAGTINGDGTLEIVVARKAEDFTIAQIARLVEQAQAQRSPAERFVDRFAQAYTPAVVLFAVAVAVVPPLAFDAPFLTPAGAAEPGWLYRGLALLIIACPCALIISIPVTVVSALTRLARLGVLVRGGARLDELARTKVFAFDKTGTLTHGQPVVASVRSLDCDHDDHDDPDGEQDHARGHTHGGQGCGQSRDHAGDRDGGHVHGHHSPLVHGVGCTSCSEVVALAATVERGSGHPFARAVLREAESRRLAHRYPHATDITTQAGRGVSGMLGSRRVTVGHADLFPRSPEIDALVSEHDASSLMLVGDEASVLGLMTVEDRARPSAARAVSALREIDPSYRVAMLTGDRRAVAEALGSQLGGIDDIHAELLPEQKLEVVRELEATHGGVAMIGDGINDTPALAAARLGIAMGGAGSHQAMEVADIVLMQDDLDRLPQAVRIARRTQRVIRQNIALSLALKIAFLALAVPGLATLWMAVLADVGATVLVTLNGMRMLKAD